MDQKELKELNDIDFLYDQALLQCCDNIFQARETAESCLLRAERMNYYKGILNAKITICALDILQGDMDMAREKLSLIEQGLLSDASSDINLMRYSYIRGLYFLYEGSYCDSFDAFQRSGVLASRMGNLFFMGLSSNGKGSIKLDQKEYGDAFKYFKDSKFIFLSGEPEILQCLVSMKQSCALRGQGKKNEALELLTSNLEKAVEQEWRILECAALDELGAIMLEEGDLDQADQYLSEGLEKIQELGDYNLHINLVYQKARLMVQQGDPGQAKKILAELSVENGNFRQRSVYYKLLTDIHEMQGDYEKALENCKILHNTHETNIVYSILKEENAILHEANHQLRLIGTIGQELVANLDIGRILNLIYAQMKVLMPVDLLIVAIVEKNHINTKFALKKGQRLKPVRIHIENESSLLAWSVRNKKEILIRDSLKESSRYDSLMDVHEDLAEESPLLSIICIPLWYIDEVVGVLSIQSSRSNAYTNRDLDNIRALGSYAGIAIRNALQTEKINEMNEILRRQSATDSLTGLVTRREMMHQGKSIWRVCRRNQFWVSVIMIDLDHFKDVNDQYGHAAGDEVLSAIGSLINQYFKRALDCACRYGGEEMMVLCGEMTPQEAAGRMALLREEFAELSFTGRENRMFHAQFSCGIYGEIPEKDVSQRLTRIVSIADSYLYEAKGSGRNCTFLSDDVNKPSKKFIHRPAPV